MTEPTHETRRRNLLKYLATSKLSRADFARKAVFRDHKYQTSTMQCPNDRTGYTFDGN